MMGVRTSVRVALMVLTFAATTSAPAFAESGILPTPGTVKVTSPAGDLTFKSGLVVKTTSDEGTLSFVGDKAGTFDILYLGATCLLGVKGKGLSDTETGSLLMSGSFLIVKMTSSDPVPNEIILSPDQMHFTCGSILTVARGRAAGSFNDSGETVTATFTQSGGVNIITSDETESGIILEGSTGGGKFEQGGLESTESGSLGRLSELMS